MAISTPSKEAAIRKAFGTYLSPGLGVAWEGKLKNEMSKLFVLRVSQLPWLPPGWLAQVQDVQSRYPDDLVRIAPSMGSIHPNAESPDWILEDPERVAAWQVIAKASDSAISRFAAAKQDEGRAELQRLYDNAAFWDKAYRIAVGVRDAAPNAAGWVVSSLWNGLGWKWKLALGVAGVAAVVTYWPKLAKLAKSATKALGA